MQIHVNNNYDKPFVKQISKADGRNLYDNSVITEIIQNKILKEVLKKVIKYKKMKNYDYNSSFLVL